MLNCFVLECSRWLRGLTAVFTSTGAPCALRSLEFLTKSLFLKMSSDQDFLFSLISRHCMSSRTVSTSCLPLAVIPLCTGVPTFAALYAAKSTLGDVSSRMISTRIFLKIGAVLLCFHGVPAHVCFSPSISSSKCGLWRKACAACAVAAQGTERTRPTSERLMELGGSRCELKDVIYILSFSSCLLSRGSSPLLVVTSTGHHRDIVKYKFVIRAKSAACVNLRWYVAVVFPSV